MGRSKWKNITCIECGRTEKVRIIGKHRMLGDWVYGGSLNVNTRKTSKYFYKLLPGKEWKTKKVLNTGYDPKIKRKYVEMWVCKLCMGIRSKSRKGIFPSPPFKTKVP